jgi:hypothetical protein
MPLLDSLNNLLNMEIVLAAQDGNDRCHKGKRWNYTLRWPPCPAIPLLNHFAGLVVIGIVMVPDRA